MQFAIYSHVLSFNSNTPKVKLMYLLLSDNMIYIISRCWCNIFTLTAAHVSKWSWKLHLEFLVYISNSDRKQRSINSSLVKTWKQFWNSLFSLTPHEFYLSMSSFPWEPYFKEGKSVELPLGTSVSFRFQLKDANSMVFCNNFVVALQWLVKNGLPFNS